MVSIAGTQVSYMSAVKQLQQTIISIDDIFSLISPGAWLCVCDFCDG